MPPFDLSGRTALVTGSARGIGYATARALVARGANVVMTDLEGHGVDQSAASIHDTRTLGLVADVTDRGTMQQVGATAVERFGSLDVVVANAGIAPRGATLRAMSGEAFDRVIAVNQQGVVNTVEVALPEIVRNRGHIVVISSVYAFANGVGVVPYAMSKAAVEQLGRALRVELVRHGASATVAHFGFIDTEMVHQGLDEDPVGGELGHNLPAFLMKRLPPQAAGEGIVLAIENRRPRLILPRRWWLLYATRGVTGPLIDAWMERDEATQAVTAKLDERGGEEQPTTH